MSLLTRTIRALGLHAEQRQSYVRLCAARLGHLRRDLGDLSALGEPYLVGMAIAAHEVPPSPGSIPEVQRRAMEYGEIAKQLERES